MNAIEELLEQPFSEPGVYQYIPAFLTPEEADALFTTCAGLKFPMRKNPRNLSTFIRHQVVAFTEKASKRASDAGDVFPLAEAPEEIRSLAAKLTAHVGNGRRVNYLSVVRYEKGEDHMNWHQHREDKGRNTPVLIVTTGAERRFGIREVGKPETAEHFVARQGSLIVLTSEANDTHEHAVSKAKGVTSPRYAVNCKCVDEKY
jgi:alkylated DNA repair dioxygenase AlkB